MSEAPKKIWVPEVWVDCLGWEETPGEEIPYIRADIVDELVEALKHSADLLECLGATALMARGALAKLEESHE